MLLDGSAYFNQINFQEQKKFAQSFVTYFRLRKQLIGPTIAVVPYSDQKITRSKMANFFYSRSISGLNNKIKKLEYQGGGSNLDDALRFTQQRLFFVPNMGARSWVPRVIVAITGSWRAWSSYQTREVMNTLNFLLLLYKIIKYKIESLLRLTS